MLRLLSRVGSDRQRRVRLGVAMVAALLAAAASAQAAPFVYVANEFSHDVSQYDAGAGGLLSPLSPPAVAADPIGNPQGVAVRPDGMNVYVTNGFTGTVSQYDVGAGGALTPKSPSAVATGNFPRAVAVSPDGGSVYVANASSDTVSQYDAGVDGALTPKSPATVTASSGPAGVAISPDGDSVYVTTGGSGTVSQYDVGPGGALTPKSPPAVAAAGNAIGIAISPDGNSVYVTTAPRDGSAKLVFQYDVGAGGVLSPKTPPTVTAGATPIGVAVSPDGTSVYITNVGSANVSQYDVGSFGALAPKSPATVAAGRFPFGVVVSPDGGSVYVTNDGDGNVSQYDVGAGGVLNPKSPATVAAGGGPVAVAVSSVVSNRPPDCSGVGGDPGTLIRPNRRLTTVALTGASDPDGDSVSFHIDGVSQDEPVTGTGDPTSPDARLTAEGADSNQVELRAERSLRRNGRVYRIAYTVSDGNGGSCSGSAADTNAKVSVPLRRRQTAVDDAPPSYDSFTGAPLP